MPGTENPISERSKQMVYQALGALQAELDVLGLDDNALEVGAIRDHLKALDDQGKLTVKRTVQE
jgi:hypothetical protein